MEMECGEVHQSTTAPFSKDPGREALRSLRRDCTGELVARGAPKINLFLPPCKRVYCSRHDRGKERTIIICSWVHVLICITLLLGLLHEPQDFHSERFNMSSNHGTSSGHSKKRSIICTYTSVKRPRRPRERCPRTAAMLFCALRSRVAC